MSSAVLPLSSNDPHAGADIVARDDWVEAKLTRSFMRNSRPALHAATLVIPVIGAILYNDVNTVALLCWVLAAVVMTLARYRVLHIYHRDYVAAGAAQLREFMARYSWTWTMSAAVWGASMFLYFRKAPVYDQFICVMVVVGMAGFAVGAFSASLRCFVGYTNGLAYSTLAAVIYSVGLERPFMGTIQTYSLVILVLIYWAAIRSAGKRFHQGQRKTLELQFANATLIASLTEKTRMALEAVQAKDRFIASAAHDLRQPVHALGLYADWLRAEPELAAQITPKIVPVHTGGQRPVQLPVRPGQARRRCDCRELAAGGPVYPGGRTGTAVRAVGPGKRPGAAYPHAARRGAVGRGVAQTAARQSVVQCRAAYRARRCAACCAPGPGWAAH